MKTNEKQNTSSEDSLINPAPGCPGSDPTWSPAAKSGVGCAISCESHIWFTLGRGIVNEVYHPWVDHAAIRDLGLIITGPDGFFSEERKDCAVSTSTTAPGVPSYLITNRCTHGRFSITKEVFADPNRDVLLQRIKFTPRKGNLEDYRLFVLTSPRLGDHGKDNSAWVGSYNGTDMLFARRGEHAMALMASARWLARSAGFVGVSDAWQDLKRHGEMTWEYTRADHGHVAVAGEIDLAECGGQFILALALDRSCDAAAVNALLSLTRSFDEAREIYVKEWEEWHGKLKSLEDSKASKASTGNREQRNRPDSSRPRVAELESSLANSASNTSLYRTSMMVLRVHRSTQVDGASVASLAVPWGNARGDKDHGGYHLVWPRDLAEESGGFLAAGAHEEALAVLNFLRVTQKSEGGWSQDMWVDGSAYSDGVQMDEAALPILLVDLARRESALSEMQAKSFWPMIRAAATFIVNKGPFTGQSRWENSPGLSPYTLATEVAALVLAARLAEGYGEPALARYLRETADLWNDLIEDWTYVTGTPLSKRIGVDGYYIRLAPSPGMKTFAERGEEPKLSSSRNLPNAEVLSPDALALVRFGLRAADDPRILNTVKAIDAVNRAQLPAGPCWRRYTGGYYGESDQGEPFTGPNSKDGHGRAWPLLTGERGHYEVAAGNLENARRMLVTMEGLCSQTGLLPEQVWDSPDLPDRDLFLGRPAGSAMPLAWTHAEYVRLLRSIREAKVFDMPVDAQERYVKYKTKSDLALWRFEHQPASFPQGRKLRLEVRAPALVHFSPDNWQTKDSVKTADSGVGLHFVDLPTTHMQSGETLTFTFQWPDANGRWEGKDFHIAVEGIERPEENSVSVKVMRPKAKTMAKAGK